MAHQYEGQLTEEDKDLLRKLAKEPDDLEVRSTLKKRIVSEPMVGAPLVDTLGSVLQRLRDQGSVSGYSEEQIEEAMKALKTLRAVAESNRFIGEYIQDTGFGHEVHVDGGGRKIIGISHEVDTSEKPLRRGEKVLVGGGDDMLIVQRLETPARTWGEHGILIKLAEDLATGTVSLDGKQHDFPLTYPVLDHIAKEKIADIDLPLPCLASTENQSVLQILPEPAITSELNPFLKRDVTLASHGGYTDIKEDFLRTVLARFMAQMENKVYLKDVDLTPHKLQSEAVGIACVGQPGSGKTTMIHATINWLDQHSLAQIEEKIALLHLYTETRGKCSKGKALKLFADVKAKMDANHKVYRDYFLLEEPDYNPCTVGQVRKWAKAYVEGFGIDAERSVKHLKRYRKMLVAKRSEVQLFLIRHEDVIKKYVGEGVGYIGLAFRKARRHNGFVFLWLPEAETIFKARGTGTCSDYNDEIVAKFNEELAGSSSNDNLVAVADSNHPQSMDDAILGHRFVRLDIGRIAPSDLHEIVRIHVNRLDLDESLANGASAKDAATEYICKALLSDEKPLAEAQRTDGKSLKIYPRDILVPRVVAFIASRARKYSLARKGKKRVCKDDLDRACREELRHQASQIRPNNLHLYVDGLQPKDQAACTHVNPVL